MLSLATVKLTSTQPCYLDQLATTQQAVNRIVRWRSSHQHVACRHCRACETLSQHSELHVTAAWKQTVIMLERRYREQEQVIAMPTAISSCLLLA